ncbi:MAG: protease inhibitor I42 family protein [Victivallaceae bacterium]
MLKKNLLSLGVLCCISLFASENECVKIEQIMTGGTVNINGSAIPIKAEKSNLFNLQIGNELYSLPQACNKFFDGYDLSTLRLIYSVNQSDRTIFATALFSSHDGKKQLEILAANDKITVTEITNSNDKNSPENSRQELFSSQTCAMTLIRTEAGKAIEIELESNPSTGFSWIPLISHQKDFITLESSNFKANDKPIPGAPGREKFIFKAQKSGSVLLIMQYRRAWEKDVAPVKEIKYFIVIESKSTLDPQI